MFLSLLYLRFINFNRRNVSLYTTFTGVGTQLVKRKKRNMDTHMELQDDN